MSKRSWRTGWVTRAHISSHRSTNVTNWSERFANTGKASLAAKKSGARSTDFSLRSKNDEARMTNGKIMTKHEARTPTCHPERSKGKSKDPAKLTWDVAGALLYFARDHKHFIRHSPHA